MPENTFFQTSPLRRYATIRRKNLGKTRVLWNVIAIVDKESHMDFMSCCIMLHIQ